MDYNGLSIVSPQYYPDDEEWNDFFNLWFQGYDLNTDCLLYTSPSPRDTR